MGRPIKKKYFGNPNLAATGEAVGGEGFSAVAVVTTGTLYSTATSYTWTGSAPQVAGGQAASGTLTIGTDGRVSSFNIGNSGSGYTSTSSVTVTVSPATTGSAATYAISLTSSRTNAIALTSRLPGASNSRTGGDIIKQESSKRYLVKNSDGTGQCKLVAAAISAAGQMTIVATDYNGNTYYVKKLSGRRCQVVQKTQNGSNAWVYADGDSARYTLGSAVGTDKTASTTCVSLASN